MFFILSKSLYFLAMPITWLIVFPLISLFASKPIIKKKALQIGVGLLILFSNPFVINELLLLWEHKPTTFDAVQPHDIGIVLTGYNHDAKSPKDRMYMTDGVDRLLYALRLYREGKIKRILICGAEVNIFEEKPVENKRSSKEVLLYAGVPDSVILIEDGSRNTRENALNAKKILAQYPQYQRYILITSGFHIWRATGCFDKVGIKTTPFSAHFYSKDRINFNLDAIMPSEDAITKWGRLIREVLGCIVYKLMGYI